MNIFFDQHYILYLSAVLVILVTIILVKIITEKEIVHPETGRKTLHFTAIMICALVVKYTQSRMELAWIFLIFSLVLLFIAHQNLLLPTKRKSYNYRFNCKRKSHFSKCKWFIRRSSWPLSKH